MGNHLRTKKASSKPRSVRRAKRHVGHGSGTALDGPDAPDCPCRGTDKQAECAFEGCGFCGVAERHCDDWIDDPNAPECLRKFLERARQPAHGMLDKSEFPKLFANYKGQRVRVVMASRFGDVGISTNLVAEHGYSDRVKVGSLTDFSDKP